jgi:hypothetical protein
MINNSHLGGYNENGDIYTWMPDIWGYLLLKYNLKSVVDVGCGMGYNLKWFHDMRIDICGVEGHPDAVRDAVVPNVILHDFTKGPVDLKRNFDLALSTEFVEHVHSQYEQNWLPVFDLCKYVLMCHAVPGQGGYHHVNEQPSEYWIERVTSRGFTHNQELTDLFRGTTKRVPSRWGRNTLLFFEKV